MNKEIVEKQRREKDRFFKEHPDSPLTPQQRATFNGLQYFDYNPALSLELVPETFTEKNNIRMQTSTGDTRYYMRWGKVYFDVEGSPAELTLFFTPGSDEFFVPFMDTTSNVETYGAGRYIEAILDPDGHVHLDLNFAYNPYCAYSPIWSCPIPPAENRLKVAIRAGEKKPVGEWVEAH